MALPLALAAIQAGGAILDGISSLRAARAQARYLQKRARENKRLALESLGETTFDVRLRQGQERAQIGEEIASIIRQSVAQRGSIGASAGAANVAGNSVQDLELDAVAQRGRATGNLRLLQEFRELQAERDIKHLTLQTKNRILSQQPGPISAPNPLGIALGAVGAGFQGFAAGKDLFPPTASDDPALG